MLRRARQRDQERRLGRRQMARLLAEIGEARGPHAFEIAAERRQGQVEAEDLVLAQAPLQAQRLGHLDQLCRQGARPPLQQAHRLHRQGRGAGDDTAAPRELAERAQRGDRVDPRMHGKALVLGGDQHAAVQRIDSRRPRPAAAICRRPVRNPRRIEPSRAKHQHRQAAGAVEGGRRQGEVGGGRGRASAITAALNARQRWRPQPPPEPSPAAPGASRTDAGLPAPQAMEDRVGAADGSTARAVYRGCTLSVPIAVRPEVSGSYMSSTTRAGYLNSPGVTARTT